MKSRFSLATFSLAAGLANAALPLPNPPWMPPPVSFGTQRSSQRSTSSQQPNAQWSTLVGDLLYFYEAQRSGNLPSTNRVSWRNSSATSDGADLGLDLTGGYYDAGDYIKCTYPMSWAMTSICWGAIDYGQGYDQANQTPYLDDMLRWGLDWLIKECRSAHPDPNTLVVQVGDGNVDNDYWGGDQGIASPRPSFVINATHPGTDAASSVAAAFAACSALYGSSTPLASGSTPASLRDPAYAQTLLTHANQLFSFATNTPFQTYQTDVPAVADVYASSGYASDVVLASLFLSLAGNSSSFFNLAGSYYSDFSMSITDTTLNWDDKSPAIPVLFTQLLTQRQDISGGSQDDLDTWRGRAERFFDRILDGKSRGYLTEGGLLFYDGDSNDASLNPALNIAMIMLRYAPLASSSQKTSDYEAFAKGQLDYALGKNPMNVPYVVGVNPNSPLNPHSAAASGGDDIGDIDSSPVDTLNVIYGAVLGGPDPHDRFYDIRSDWPETEVALDYNAPMLTLAAMGVSKFSDDPYYTSLEDGAYASVKPSGTPCDEAFPCEDGLSRGATIAIAVVITPVGLVLIGFLARSFMLRRAQRAKNKSIV
ncbi:glycoside hydrolase family 9 protein [Botryobasidium botryosum FD-172 SS1]|uniref:Endoglucanase n=1 Tax=Botryobasidium botryosum (strain FD-172 SS1) TaxID=930990 RepID=A0A067MIN9_BOTB1|nr:glycoside hydrolase family 9 protein [Botryobasidium botryosum FD-172 SS1]